VTKPSLRPRKNQRLPIILVALLAVNPFFIVNTVKACNIVWCDEKQDGWQRFYAGFSVIGFVKIPKLARVAYAICGLKFGAINPAGSCMHL
jgi:hypothetical protein